MDSYVLIKSLNNNIVLCYDNISKKEVVVFGKGIGFGKNNGDLIDAKKIDRIYEFKEKHNLDKYQKLIVNNSNIVDITEEIISAFIKEFGNKYNENLHVTLLDHLVFAIKRQQEKMNMEFVFIDEIKYMYPREYEFTKKTLKYLKKKLKIDFPNGEIGFLLMHFHAALNQTDASTSHLIFQIISYSIDYINESFNLDLNDFSLYKQRLITHLKFAIKRSIDKVQLENPISEMIVDKYPKTYELAEQLGEKIKENYFIELNQSEICYLTVHIQNIVNQMRRK